MSYVRVLKVADPKFASQLKKVDNGYVDSNGKASSCWEFTGGKFANGYGRVHGKETGEIKAHRHSYALTKGRIGKRNGKALLVLHKCDIRACCNPRHLYASDHRKNMQDMVDRKRQAKGEDNGNSNLLASEVAFLRLLLEVGFSHKQAGEINMTPKSTVSKLRNIERWASVQALEKTPKAIRNYIQERARSSSRLRSPELATAKGNNATSISVPVRWIRECVSMFGQEKTAIMLDSSRKKIRCILELDDSVVLSMDTSTKAMVQHDPNKKIRDFILKEIEKVNT